MSKRKTEDYGEVQTITSTVYVGDDDTLPAVVVCGSFYSSLISKEEVEAAIDKITLEIAKKLTDNFNKLQRNIQ